MPLPRSDISGIEHFSIATPIMAALRTFLARRLCGPNSSAYRQSQRRWARVHDVRFTANHGVQDRIIDRYKDKLDRKAKEYGRLAYII
jgi:ATP synthase F1 complex assembly factor 1